MAHKSLRQIRAELRQLRTDQFVAARLEVQTPDGETLFTVLHLVEFSPTDELRVGEVNVFVGRNFVLSVRNRSTQGFLGVRERSGDYVHAGMAVGIEIPLVEFEPYARRGVEQRQVAVGIRVRIDLGATVAVEVVVEANRHAQARGTARAHAAEAIGGAFGSKGHAKLEPLVALLAYATGRPVRLAAHRTNACST